MKSFFHSRGSESHNAQQTWEEYLRSEQEAEEETAFSPQCALDAAFLNTELRFCDVTPCTTHEQSRGWGGRGSLGGAWRTRVQSGLCCRVLDPSGSGGSVERPPDRCS